MVLGPDFAVYAVHAAFWGGFGVTRAVLRSRAGNARGTAASSAPVADEAKTAPHSRALVGLHMLAFGVMYFGLGDAVIPDRVPRWFVGQRFVSSAVVLLGGALAAWSLVYFRSWRFRAKVERGHELATGGPFRLLRHPIYMGLNLLALGTAIWVPTPALWASVALMVLGSDLRARSEEKLLRDAFGETYASYCGRTRRFVPGIY
jgi:protein-S-isoprenylcysteine O-methyltransferase Ste14